MLIVNVPMDSRSIQLMKSNDNNDLIVVYYVLQLVIRLLKYFRYILIVDIIMFELNKLKMLIAN
jgi:hypothetical protein